MAVMTSSPTGRGAHPWVSSQTKSNCGSAALWQLAQLLPENRLITSAPPRLRMVVPAGVGSRVKNSQSLESGSKPGARLTMASWGISWMIVPTG
jgi:hypothetical protein